MNSSRYLLAQWKTKDISYDSEGNGSLASNIGLTVNGKAHRVNTDADADTGSVLGSTRKSLSSTVRIGSEETVSRAGTSVQHRLGAGPQQ